MAHGPVIVLEWEREWKTCASYETDKEGLRTGGLEFGVTLFLFSPMYMLRLELAISSFVTLSGTFWLVSRTTFFRQQAHHLRIPITGPTADSG
jgi:hypothetical protein